MSGQGWRLFSSQVREILWLCVDVFTKQFLQRAGFVMAASGATAVLITGFPTLAKFTHPDVTPVGEVSVNVVSYGVILTRAPFNVLMDSSSLRSLERLISSFFLSTTLPFLTVSVVLSIYFRYSFACV